MKFFICHFIYDSHSFLSFQCIIDFLKLLSTEEKWITNCWAMFKKWKILLICWTVIFSQNCFNITFRFLYNFKKGKLTHFYYAILHKHPPLTFMYMFLNFIKQNKHFQIYRKKNHIIMPYLIVITTSKTYVKELCFLIPLN